MPFMMFGMTDWDDMQHLGTRLLWSGNIEVWIMASWTSILLILSLATLVQKHWNRTSVRVEALKRIDQMRDRIHDAYRIQRHKRMRDDEEDMNAN